MSEALLTDKISQLRFLARAGVQVDASGRRLSGVINPVIEALRLDLLEILELLQDGRQLPQHAADLLASAQAITDLYRTQVRSLRREFA